MKSKIINFIFPQTCWICRKAKASSLICQACKEHLPWILQACQHCGLPLEVGTLCGSCLIHPPAFCSSIIPFKYKPPISNLIRQFKFNQQLTYGHLLAKLLVEQIYNSAKPLPKCIIPVPLHPLRIKERGFNQSLEIAKYLGKQLRLPVLRDSIIRIKNTEPQSQLTAAARKKNMIAAFKLKQSIEYEHAAIVDDVMTTGQTLRSLSQMLQKNGFKTLQIWCCARAN